MRVLFIIFSALLVAMSTPAIACGDNEYEQCTSDIPAFRVCGCLPKGPALPNLPPIPKLPSSLDPLKIILNPTGYVNSSGIPTTGDFVEEAFRNPDRVIQLIGNPGMIPYLPVATGMISSRNAIVLRGKPIPENIKQMLSPWYSRELMDSVRWTSDYGPIQNTFQAWQMEFGDNTAAVTVINGVVFHDEIDTLDPVLWSHELYHVWQYKDWGVFEFARQWVLNPSVTGPVEAPAYQREEEVRQKLGLVNSGPISTPYNPQGSTCVTQINSCPWPTGNVGWPCSCVHPYGLQYGTIH